jgi:hypothetical protein
MPATHQAIIVGRPIWATGGFAIGVFGGVLGCIFLLLKRRSSINIFLMSLLGIIIFCGAPHKMFALSALPNG